MTDEDFRAMVRQRIDDLEKAMTIALCGIAKQIDDMQDKMDQLDGKVSRMNNYRYMVVGIISMLPIITAIIVKGLD